MTTFEFPKAFDEVEDAPQIDDGIYKMALARAPYEAPSKKGGTNIVLDLMITGEGAPMDGVTLNYWISKPVAEDFEKTTKKGQSMVDWKSQRADDIAKALGGSFKGKILDIPDSAMCKAKVVNKIGDSGNSYLQIDGDLMEIKPASAKKKS
jgi:hypothetical protein